MSSGHEAHRTLPDGRSIAYLDAGDPTGQPFFFQPGSPNTRVMGRLWHDAAHTAGVRLIGVSRPGYPGTTAPAGRPTLSAAGRDVADLATVLGLDAYAVLGSCGGAPFAAATAAADPGRVRVLGIVAGVGPWRELEDPSVEPDERACLALLEHGDLTGARAGLRHLIENVRQADLREYGDRDRLDAWLADDPHAGDPTYRTVMADALRAVLDGTDGAVGDALALGAGWDFDPRTIQAPTLLWYGDADDTCPPAHGHWYADRVPAAHLSVLPGQDHLAVADANRPEILTALLKAW